MNDENRIDEVLDACPLPPGSKRPEKNIRSKLLNFYDDFFANWKLVASILTLMSIVLAYSLLSIPPPLISSVRIPDAWNRSFPEYMYPGRKHVELVSQFEKQTVHEGDLILDGDDVLVIENSTYILNGGLLVQDHARLILRNAELLIQEKDGGVATDLLPFFVNAVFNNSATLEVYNSSIYHDYRLYIVFLQSSEAIIDSSELNRVTIYLEDESTLNLSRSYIGFLNVAKDSMCTIIDSELSLIRCFSIYHFVFCGYERHQRLWDDCRVEIWNSTIRYVKIELWNCSATVSSRFHGFHSFWNSYINLSADGSILNLTLHDTNVIGKMDLRARSDCKLKVVNRNDLGSVDIENGSLQVSNSSIRLLSCGEGSGVEVKDSIFEWFYLKDDSKTWISRSRTDRLYIEDFEGTAIFDNILVNEIKLDNCEAYLGGSIRFRENASAEYSWASGLITRGYEVQTHKGERILPNVKLTLYDEEDTVVWDGETGNDGKAYFNISYCKIWPLYEPYKYVTNYDELWNLEASQGDTSYNASVGLFKKDTPIVFTFPSGPEQPFWMQRWVLSVSSASIIIVMIIGYLLNRLLTR